MDSNENKTTISMTDNINFKENPFKGMSMTTAAVIPVTTQVSYKRVYSKPTHQSDYSVWNHNSVLYKFNQNTQKDQDNKKLFEWNWDWFKLDWGGQGLR